MPIDGEHNYHALLNEIEEVMDIICAVLMIVEGVNFLCSHVGCQPRLASPFE